MAFWISKSRTYPQVTASGRPKTKEGEIVSLSTLHSSQSLKRSPTETLTGHLSCLKSKMGWGNLVEVCGMKPGRTCKATWRRRKPLLRKMTSGSSTPVCPGESAVSSLLHQHPRCESTGLPPQTAQGNNLGDILTKTLTEAAVFFFSDQKSSKCIGMG